MPNETLAPVLNTENAIDMPQSVEFGPKHFEAACESRANYHKARILEKFGDLQHLPQLPDDSPTGKVPESEKRFKKAYDLLQREMPSEIPPAEDGVTKDYILAVADNLAWKGIENSLISSHLLEINNELVRLAQAGKAIDPDATGLKDRGRALKTAVLEDNHFYRDFFDSEQASALGVDSPKFIKHALEKSSILISKEDSALGYSRGISLEIASLRYLSKYLAAEDEDIAVGYGTSEQDRTGGDIVVGKGSKTLFIDLKNSRPDGVTEDEITDGFRLHNDSDRGFYKAIAWSESREPVGEDSFRLNDPLLRSSLRELTTLIR